MSLCCRSLLACALLLLGLSMAIAAPCAAVADARAAAVDRQATGTIDERHAALHAAYAEKLAELAAWAEGQQLAAEAKLTAEWLPPRRPNRIMLACRPAPGDEERSARLQIGRMARAIW